MIKGNIFRIKTNKKDTWVEWCSLLAGEYRKEATDTLHEEALIRELFIIFEKDFDYFTIGLGESEGEILPANMTKEINRRHKDKKKECLEYIGPVSVLYDLKAD